MKHIAVGIFILIVLGVMTYLWHAMQELRMSKYGRCWPLIKATIEDLWEHTVDHHYQQQIRKRSELDLHILEDHILNYSGLDSIDEEIAIFDSRSHFFDSLKQHITPHWHLQEAPLIKILDEAIYAYNIDIEYNITPRQFLDYLGFQFEYYFISKL